MTTQKEAEKLIKKIFNQGFNEGYIQALDQIKNTHLTIKAESQKELEERLKEYTSKGWVLITPTYFYAENQTFIHAQVIFKPQIDLKKIKKQQLNISEWNGPYAF
jgi:uncharacterized protein HemY